MGLTKLIFFAVLAFGAWYVYRRFVADAIKLAKKSEAKRKEQNTGAQGTLVQDPITGEYRLRRKEDN